MTTASSSTANPLNAGDGEMGAALYVPDVQRMVRLTLQPCGGCGGKAYAVEAALSRPVREVRGQLAALLLGGEGTASPSWWARLTAQTGAASQEKAPLASDVHLFLADGGEAATYTALPDDTLLQDLLTDGESRDELTLHYTAEKKFGDDGELCLACFAAWCAAEACCCAAQAIAANEQAKPPKPPVHSTNNNYYYQNANSSAPGNANGGEYNYAGIPQGQSQPIYYSGGNYAANAYGVPPPGNAPPPPQQQPVTGQPVYSSPSLPPAQYGNNAGGPQPL